MENKVKKITVGDNSGISRKGRRFTTTRPTLLRGIEIGEEVLVRFKDDCGITGYRRYRVTRKFFKDHFDADREVYTGEFERMEEAK